MAHSALPFGPLASLRPHAARTYPHSMIPSALSHRSGSPTPWQIHVNLTAHPRSTQKERGESIEMNAYKNLLSPDQQRRLQALNAWHQVLDDAQLRMDCPDAYHEALLRQADEMDRLGIVTWTEWRDLRREADQAYLRAVAGEDYH